MNKSRLLDALLMAGLAVSPGCMQYKPDAARVKQQPETAPFLVKASSVEGIYGNQDIDCLVFRYTTGADDPDEFWNLLDEQLKHTEWRVLPPEGDVRRFERITPKRGMGFCGSEEVRVYFNEQKNRVTVAWVQGDSFDDVTSFSETDEAEWAKAEAWPKMDAP